MLNIDAMSGPFRLLRFATQLGDAFLSLLKKKEAEKHLRAQYSRGNRFKIETLLV